MARIKVGIINVTGYVGADLARILARHPHVEITSVTGRSEAGRKLAEVFPHLAAIDLTIQPELGDVDIAFSALPHKASAEVVIPLVKMGLRVIDNSADFRLKDPVEYQRWYEHVHPGPDMLASAVYGLPEIHREQIRKATLVANPGCYPTSAILGLAPALKAGLTEGHIVVDSKSGVSGAGRTLKLESHFCEVNENVSAYGLKGHRHLPEIVQELSEISGKPLSLTFVPHLMPMTRGMLSSCYAKLIAGTLTGAGAQTEVRNIYRDFYKDAPFVRIVDAPPQTKHTLGSNMCLVHPAIDHRTGTLVVISCIDNLVKGAAGQAVQNMNLMFGLPETMGIDMLALYP
ncbi:MAG: N-acetyl-gamma-glutamyl-phosphate reductase [Dehalococcoidia bacterium]|nr:N-acetyl-gamma-glutamyl-phosphate reductase [Dehalococcoidia bacterium]